MLAGNNIFLETFQSLNGFLTPLLSLIKQNHNINSKNYDNKLRNQEGNIDNPYLR